MMGKTIGVLAVLPQLVTVMKSTFGMLQAVQAAFQPIRRRDHSLNAEGIAVVQGWVDKSLSNYGFTVQNYDHRKDYWIVASKENTSSYINHPQHHLLYALNRPNHYHLGQCAGTFPHSSGNSV